MNDPLLRGIATTALAIWFKQTKGEHEMNIVDERKRSKSLCYSELNPGDIFEFVNDLEHDIYMKTDDSYQPSICLTKDFKLHNFLPTSEVRRLNVELHILR